MQRWCVDRFEDDIAVLENEERRSLNIKKSDLPPGVKVSDWLCLDAGVWSPDAEYTRQAAERIADKMKKLWK